MSSEFDADDSGPISTMWVVDRQQLCRTLDEHQLWKDLASQRELNISSDEVNRLAMLERSKDSPSDGLLHLMSNKRVTIMMLFGYLKEANLLSAMSVIKRYVPTQYHTYLHLPDSHPGLESNSNPQDLEPAAPPPLPDDVNAGGPQQLMSIQEGLLNSSSSLEDSLMSSMPADLNPAQIQAAHTIIATRHFDIKDIERATDNFSDEYLIFKNGYSSLYRVVLENTLFAAKIYNMDYEAVLADLQVTRIHSHANIVPITGKCLVGDNVIMLYEYMTNGSLRKQIDSGGILSMDRRAAILRDAARGLQYLHSNKPPLIHRNVKSTNILLDDGFRAKLSDFGFAVHANKRGSSHGSGSQSYTHYSTREDTSAVQRSKGYCAKEVLNGRFIAKSDTYAFGVVIFEVCTGLPPYNLQKRIADRELVDYIERVVTCMEDAWRLKDDTIRWEPQTYNELFRLAQKCTSEQTNTRPTMSQVYEDLAELIQQMPTHMCKNDAYDPQEESMLPEPQPMYSNPVHGNPAIVSPLANNMSLPAGHYNQYFYGHGSYAPLRFPIESASPHPQFSSLPHNIAAQTSETNSSISDLDLTSFPSVPETPGPASRPDTGGEELTPSLNLVSHDASLVNRDVNAEEESDNRENPTPVATADFSNLISTYQEEALSSADSEDLETSETPNPFDYLMQEASRVQNLTAETEDTEGAELDPALVDELTNLNLGS